ncbi:MAG: SDR family NAD(P)-dependent oxidoreductase [Gammaproteobacteria bacterium]|nr:SDR family NAD(P)-dependent oxidoreductase [Gammaproteobacteria bacterium]
MTTLDGKLALVTGAAGVLGFAIARALAAQGLRMILADVNGDAVETRAAAIGPLATPCTLDVGNADAVARACALLRERHGSVDVLVNNAGILSNDKAVETTPQAWRRLLAVNLDGAFYLARECLPGMRASGWGRIVNICSLAMKTGGITAGTAYTTSKGGLAALTFSLARETTRDGITVNGIAPAYINTPMVTEQLTEAQRRKLLAEIPVGRFCEADEVAHVVAFLVSPMSGFITGEIIDINGGLHLD